MHTATTSDATKYVDINGLRIRCESAGEGPPVLILHGWGGSIESVRPVLAAVAPVATGWAIDLPGFGESDAPPAPWGTPEYAELVCELMDTLGLEVAAVIGHSKADCRPSDRLPTQSIGIIKDAHKLQPV